MLSGLGLKKPTEAERRTSDRLVVGGDPFRLRADGSWEQEYNVAWVRAIGMGIFDVQAVDLLAPDQIGISLEANENHIKYWQNNRMGGIPDYIECKIRSVLGDNSAYIGFETPENIWSIVGEISNVAIDLRIHPCRFSRDYLLLVRGHRIDVKAVADAPVIQRELKFSAACMQLEYLASGDRSSTDPLDALLALQMSTDSALLAADGFVSLADHSEALSEIERDHRFLWVKPHPHQSPEDDVVDLVVRIPNARLTSMDTYSLLAGGRVRTAVAISSSVLHEALLFGVEPVALRPDLSHGLPIRSEYEVFRLRDVLGPLAAVLNQAGDASGIILGEEKTLRHLVSVEWSTGSASSRSPLKAPALPGSGTAFSHPDLTTARVAGWHPAEAWGAWTEGLAALDFAWPDDNPDEIAIQMLVTAFCGDSSQGADVQFWSAGKLLLDCVLPDNSKNPVDIFFSVPRPVDTKTAQILIFRKAPKRPLDLGLSLDGRLLGVAVLQFGRADF